MILFENLFKPRQLYLQPQNSLELTSSVLSTTSKQCFEQPVTSSLIDALVFIAYNQKEKFSPEKHIE
ncbi:S1 RNA-binding domain-containing protein [Streptococcus pneumoniae]|nr:S1 RNA-binding domain-containing protein [Streptococcus pneumoniae]